MKIQYFYDLASPYSWFGYQVTLIQSPNLTLLPCLDSQAEAANLENIQNG